MVDGDDSIMVEDDEILLIEERGVNFGPVHINRMQ